MLSYFTKRPILFDTGTGCCTFLSSATVSIQTSGWPRWCAVASRSGPSTLVQDRPRRQSSPGSARKEPEPGTVATLIHIYWSAFVNRTPENRIRLFGHFMSGFWMVKSRDLSYHLETGHFWSQYGPIFRSWPEFLTFGKSAKLSLTYHLCMYVTVGLGVNRTTSMPKSVCF